jgi:hypothetical protein
MRKFLDARCVSCGFIQEEFGELDATYRCNSCGDESKRIVTPIHFKLEGTSGHFPTASDKWARDRINRAKKKKEDN